MHLSNQLLSGIEINQNVASDTTSPDAVTIHQDFNLPAGYVRGSDDDELRIPDVTGFSVMTTIDEDIENVVVVDYSFERYIIGTGWTSLIDGTVVGAPATGDQVWFDVYFDNPVPLELTATNSDFRISITGRTNGGRVNESVDYSDGIVTLDNNAIPVSDLKVGPYLFSYDGYPAIIWYDPITTTAYFSQQQGFSAIWYANLAESTYSTAYTEGGNITSVPDVQSPLTFRLLSATGDTGRDLFGNAIRYAIKTHEVNNVSTVDGEKGDLYWLSKPNPSAFAVENQYFDLTQDGSPSVIDSVLIDPITPDVYFTIYYTSEGDPGVDSADWDSKLWTRVPKTFKAHGRETYVLPQPFTAKYAKIEYTHLQPRVYRAGPFQQPIRYKKHPKWVLDYFLLRLENEQTTQEKFIPNTVSLEYNALDLAYNYYLDDLHQSAELPVHFESTRAEQLREFFLNRQDISDQVDSQTLDKINFATNPYRQGIFNGADTLLADIVGGNTVVATETGRDLFRDLSSDVSSLNRDAVVFEQIYPVMFFYLTCRHYYRELQALPTFERAYFVGIREVAWMRNNYSKATDTNLYIEIGGDSTNLQSNDFIHDDNALVISSG